VIWPAVQIPGFDEADEADEADRGYDNADVPLPA
jgi:hypothetical protein